MDKPPHQTNAKRLVLGLVVWLWGFPLFADDDIHINFAIAEQPLADAINDVARTVDFAILYNPSDISAYRAPALNGYYTATEAIDHLISALPLRLQRITGGWTVQKIPEMPVETTAPTVAEFDISSPIEEVKVIGVYHSSLSEASRKRRNANQRADYVLAADIADFPAKNIAEAMNRIPGVSVQRDRGEALFVSIRGLPTQFNQLTLNDLPIATNENTRTSEQYGHRFHYDTLPAELIAEVEVKKSTQASDPAGSIGGSVNIKSYQPLLTENRMGIKLMGSQSDKVSQTDPKLSMFRNWVNDDKSIGLLLAGSFSERHIRQDRVLAFDWKTVTDPTTGEASYYAPNLRPTLEFEERQHYGLNGALQWRPNSHHLFSASYLFLQQVIDYREYSYSADFQLDQLIDSQSEWQENKLIRGYTTQGTSQISQETSGLTDLSEVLEISHQWLKNDWLLASKLSFSSSSSKNHEPIKRTRFRREGNVAFEFALPAKDQDLPYIRYDNLDLTNANLFPGRRLEWRRNTVRDKLLVVDVQLTHNLSGDWWQSADIGIQHRYNRRNYQRKDRIFTDNFTDQYFDDQYFHIIDEGFLSKTDNQLPKHWIAPDESWFWQNIDDQIIDLAPLTPADQRNTYSIADNIWEGYLQLNIDRPDMWGNLGIRVASSNRHSQGFLTIEGSEAIPSAVEFHTDSLEWLPAFNLAYEPVQDWLVRGSVSRNISPPNTPDVAPHLILNSGNEKRAKGGNPYLDTIEAWQFDIGLDTTFKEFGQAGVTLFYTELDGFVQQDITTIELNNESYQLQAKSNGGSAQIRGIELFYQQLLNPFQLAHHQLGFNINATITESKAHYRHGEEKTTSRLEGVAKYTANAEFFYETGKWASRINYSWSSNILDQAELSTMPARYIDSFGSLDAHLSINLMPNTQIFLEATNLLNSAERDYVLDHQFTNYTHYGKTLMLGIKWQL